MSRGKKISLGIVTGIGVLIILAVILANEPKVKPPQNEAYTAGIVARSTLVQTSEGEIYLLTRNELMLLDGHKLVPVKNLDGTFSKIFWNDNKFYLSEDSKEGDVETNFLVLDAKFNELYSHTIPGRIYDFVVRDSTAYLLVDNKLMLLEINTNNPIASVDLRKPGKSIVANGNYAYIIDDIPMYIHIIDISNPHNPLKYTGKLSGVDAYLDTQDFVKNKWYILDSWYTNTEADYSQYLNVLGTKPQDLATKPALYELTNYKDFNVPATGKLYISDIKVEGDLLYALGYSSGHSGIKLSIFSLTEVVKQLSLIELDDADEPINFVLDGKKVYVAGQNGVYVVDAQDPSKPLVLYTLP